MQLAYQFPERLERLVLVSSGGLGREVHLLLRAAALPGGGVSCCRCWRRAAARAPAASWPERFGELGLRAGPDLEEIARGFASLGDIEARQAFVHTAALDHRHRAASASTPRDRLYLAENVPTL